MTVNEEGRVIPKILCDTYNEVYHKTIETVLSMGVVRGGTKEIRGLSFGILNPTSRMVWNSVRNTNYEFAMKFFIWMLNGDTDSSWLIKSNDNAKNFIDDKQDAFSTAYGPRIRRQLDSIVDELRNVETRRACIMILYPDDCDLLKDKRAGKTKTEYPCTAYLIFSIVPRKFNGATFYSLDLDVHMRSNNVVTTICYDVFNFTMLHEYVANLLHGVRMGWYFHHMDSAHIYAEDIDRAKEILSSSLTIDDTLVRRHGK